MINSKRKAHTRDLYPDGVVIIRIDSECGQPLKEARDRLLKFLLGVKYNLEIGRDTYSESNYITLFPKTMQAVAVRSSVWILDAESQGPWMERNKGRQARVKFGL